tara:strand:- start:77 stop:325 length:249 start_codon:yes stop_codon:yes gene_type:complete
MECCICEVEIELEDWQPAGAETYGHNAEPVVEGGRCCTDCNRSTVTPARLIDYGGFAPVLAGEIALSLARIDEYMRRRTQDD